MHLRALSACYELKGDLSPVILKEIFHHSLKISKFTRICMENPQVAQTHYGSPPTQLINY